jgi:hypothetical protein
MFYYSKVERLDKLDYHIVMYKVKQTLYTFRKCTQIYFQSYNEQTLLRHNGGISPAGVE